MEGPIPKKILVKIPSSLKNYQDELCGIEMNICASCGKKKAVSALVCEFCKDLNAAGFSPTMEGVLEPDLANILEKNRQLQNLGKVPELSGKEQFLVVVRGTQTEAKYPLDKAIQEWIIGRTEGPGVVIDLTNQEDPSRIWVSRRHALITKDYDQLFLEDLNSSNGTYLNSIRVYPGDKKQLKIGDQIQVGNVCLEFGCI